MPRTTPFIRTAAEIAPDWLGEALGRTGLELRSVQRIGTGQMSQSHRVRFAADGGPEETVVVKLASEDPMSRATGVGMGAYAREIAFYANLAPRFADGPLAACHLAAYDPAEGWFTLVLEDVAGATQGDQIAGCGVDDARVALGALAQLQAPVLGDVALGAADWLNQPNPLTQALLSQLLPGFVERYRDRLDDAHVEVCERFVAVLDGWAADRRPPAGLAHGDYRLDNLLFGDGRCTVVDWQTVSWGPAMLDAAYFVGGGLTVEDRRAHEESLVRGYYDELLAHGASGLSWEQCWEEYRRATFHGVLMAVAASMVVERTARGDDMFMTSLARHAQQVLDLDALALLPAGGGTAPPPLRPSPDDEARHEPGPEALWNESWYFDAVDDGGELGVYVRLGRLPNQDVALYTACVCGPGRPSIMLVEAAAPLPAADDEEQRIAIDGLRAEQACEAPLERFRVRVAGTAAAHDDPSAPLRGEDGTPVEIALDLVWETDGVPYQWRQATRYEIPCRVSGTVRVGDEEVELRGAGQRDHSWGARDWWASDWMWSALHLEDGTHVHAVGVPQVPGFGVGYVQRDGALTEVSAVRASEDVAVDGLITRAAIGCGAPGELELDVEPLAFGALRLEAPDGRVSHFPRAMCRVRAADGRAGVGWVEWNRNQR